VTYTWVYIVFSIFGLMAVIAGGFFFLKNGTMKAAGQTIEILKEQVSALKDRVGELEKLEPLVKILQGLVTQAAPVKDLADKSEQHHEENIQFLTRLEGSLSRLESHVILGRDRLGNP
jgi:uncharacterized protein YneF (UPF0154 family)